LGIEEIVVTARKREESLQDVPISISAFPGSELETYQVDNIVDLETLVPNVTLTESGGLTTGSLLVFIRGIGSDPGFAQGVGIYTDDVYLNLQAGALLEVLDVERIEVLKGPQGHLYGRNTLGGAIRYITRKPGDELRVRFDGGFGRFTEWFARGSISGPISQTLGGSLSLLYRQRDPIQKNTFTATEEGEFWGADIGAYRASLQWAPSEAVRFSLGANITSDGSEPRVGKRVGVNAAQLAQIENPFSRGASALVPNAAPIPTANDVRPFGESDHPDRISTEFTAATGAGGVPGSLVTGKSLDDYEINTQAFSLTAEFDGLFPGAATQLQRRFDFAGNGHLLPGRRAGPRACRRRHHPAPAFSDAARDPHHPAGRRNRISGGLCESGLAHKRIVGARAGRALHPGRSDLHQALAQHGLQLPALAPPAVCGRSGSLVSRPRRHPAREPHRRRAPRGGKRHPHGDTVHAPRRHAPGSARCSGDGGVAGTGRCDQSTGKRRAGRAGPRRNAERRRQYQHRQH